MTEILGGIKALNAVMRGYEAPAVPRTRPNKGLHGRPCAPGRSRRGPTTWRSNTCTGHDVLLPVTAAQRVGHRRRPCVLAAARQFSAAGALVIDGRGYG